MYYIIILKTEGPNQLKSRYQLFNKELAFEVARKLNFIANGTEDFVQFRPILVSAVGES